MRSGYVIVEVRGKLQKSWQVKSFYEAFALPYNFVVDDHKFTLRKHVNEDGEETDTLILDIDAIPFTKHPYVDSDFSKLIFFSVNNPFMGYI